MKKYPVIDTHYHLGTSAGGCNNEEQLFTWMEKYGIDIQIIMQLNEGTMHVSPEWNPCIGNDFIGRMQKKYPNKIMGIGTIIPWYQPPKYYLRGPKKGQPFDLVTRNPVLEEVDRVIKDLGLYGLKIHPLEHGYQINNPYIMFPIFERMSELSKECGRKLIVFIHAAGDDIGNTPEAIADVAKRFPELIFIVAHCGYQRAIHTLVSTLAGLPNVMLDLTTVAIPGLLYDAYPAFGPERFCAGADGPFATGTMKETIVNSLTQNEDERALILGGNLMKLFGLEWNK